MEKIDRQEAPGWLKENCVQWGKEWAAKYAETKRSSAFQWHQYQNKGYNDLLQDLAQMTQHHCSYCDAYPMGRRIPCTIDHFKPKTHFPLDAYKWENLFLSCGLCQEKGDTFHDLLLKPDEDRYSFDKYFDIDWVTGELKPNRNASPKDRERAEITIKHFRLNDNGKPEDRQKELEMFEQMKAPSINDFSSVNGQSHDLALLGARAFDDCPGVGNVFRQVGRLEFHFLPAHGSELTSREAVNHFQFIRGGGEFNKKKIGLHSDRKLVINAADGTD
ncbi:MAG: TIGR02646 family protein [Acidobacteria bacterium]|nr:TIGR02646 family protein [Acidobacteriota bacterium]